MNILDLIQSGNGAPLAQISRQFGISEDQTAQVVKQILPALTQGVKQNITQEGGLESLLGAFRKGGHERFLDDADALASERAVKEGNGILGHLLKSKDNSSQLAQKAAANTGLDLGMIKKMLPLIAGVAMGALKKKGSSDGLLNQPKSGKASSPSLGSLLSMLDADGDGSPVNDLMGFAKKLF
jgi:hypothetical protein